jgi:hypothetical protein
MAIADVDNVIEINEEDIGWNAFTWAIEKNLPGSFRRKVGGRLSLNRLLRRTRRLSIREGLINEYPGGLQEWRL